MSNPNRNRLYALLQIGKKQLAMDDETYRAFLASHGATEKNGHISASTMGIGNLAKAVSDLEKKGFRPTRQSNVSRISNWRKPRINKIKALWFALADAGVVHERNEQAMEKFCLSLIKASRMEWSTSNDLNKCIEALKSWGKREGVSLD